MKIDDNHIMKEQFIELLNSTKREGIDKAIIQLEEIGFFEAPASTKFHLCKKGGLMEHSLNVYTIAMDIRETLIRRDENLEDLLPMDSVIITCLLHDVCKADIYKPVVKCQNNMGVCGHVSEYELDYQNLPIGHGEKSVVVLLRCGLDLTDDEILAIRWHMNAWDLAFQSEYMRNNFCEAKKLTPLLTLVQSADAVASGICECFLSK